MTREAKIGMLTGLGVIVLIGVLLSQYLGDPQGTLIGGPAGAGNIVTGRMAPLPVGETYRKQVTDPVSVPAVGNAGAQLAGGPEIISPINTTNGVVPPTIFAAGQMTGESGPVISGAVSPIAAGPMPANNRNAAGIDADPPVITMADASYHVPMPGVAAENSNVNQTAAAVATEVASTTNATYTIAAKDNLNKIAKKFYNSSTNADLKRIVAANPGMLKDVNSTLVEGKKLIIPGVAVPVVKKTVAPDQTQKPNSGMVYMPGGTPKANGPVADATRKVESPKKDVTKTYEVKSGDTLEKIAKKIAPQNTTDMVQKLMTMNGIKDPHGLQTGAKIKVPASMSSRIA